MRATSSNPELDRIRQDLSAMRDAADIGLPFGPEVVRFWLVIAAASTLVAGTLAFGRASHQLLALGGFAVIGAALLAAVIIHLGRTAWKRDEHAAAWREYRQITRMKAIVLPFVIAFFVWQAWIGVPTEFLASTIVFFVGVVSLLYAISSWTRHLAAGLAFPIMVFGALIPVLSPGQRALAGACAVAVASLLAAAILARQLARARPGGSG